MIAVALLANAALSQGYPVRPVRVIVNFPPGAGVDIATRIVTARLGETFGQQFVIDNRAGAAGNIGVELGARAAPDGYTLLSGTAAIAISQSIFSKRLMMQENCDPSLLIVQYRCLSPNTDNLKRLP